MSYKFTKQTTIREVIDKLSDLTGLKYIQFDDSRAWSLYTRHHSYNVKSFGAYRNYMGGGMFSDIHHNGEKTRRNYTKGELFMNALLRIEELYDGKRNE